MLVAYGVTGTLLVVLLLGGVGSGEEDQAELMQSVRDPGPPLADTLPRPEVPEGEVQPALTGADLERLLVEGTDARGRLVRAELFCGTVIDVSVRSVDEPEEAVEVLVDDRGRVSGAECRWGRRGEARREDFFLLVPSVLAEDFASAPQVEDGFVVRRHVVADIEWIGRSDMLSLRTAGVLRRVVTP